MGKANGLASKKSKVPTLVKTSEVPKPKAVEKVTALVAKKAKIAGDCTSSEEG